MRAMYQYHPCAARGSLLKVQEIIGLAKGEDGGREQLASDPDQFIQKHGILLTSDELAAVSDVVHNTSKSVFAPSPPNAPFDKMAALRKMWNDK
jgi:hypothetical protein